MRGLFLSTEMIDVQDRDDFWRDAVKPIYDLSSTNEEVIGGFSGTLHSHPVGGMLVGSTTHNAQRYQRTHRIIAQGGMNQYILQVIMEGNLVGNFGEVDVNAEFGDIVILDLAKTIKSNASAGARITVVLPREELERMSGGRSLHGTVLRANVPNTRLLLGFLKSLNDVSSDLNAAETTNAYDAVMLLLRSAVLGLGIGNDTVGSINFTMRRRIMDFIDENLTNPLLGPSLIVSQFKVSRSHLYRSFESDGGVAKLIRERRLDLAYREIINAGPKPATLKEVAYRSGFLDAARFAKAFSSRFGSPPKAIIKNNTPVNFSEAKIHTLHDHLSVQARKLGIW
ncbi:helix-turn-helix domain-containing protein [Brucella sp. NBRC 12950]|uniref:helix-turn-helix domain-containing protein n=1 Tax=Brucella sp. NBRC 12950 TaxID=2994518 RepID=UPI0025541C9C|nr:helix-turn-helix domain-containing protein [Brucella sp. NBRC 12950]